jgi:hypothetical protein
MSYYVGDYYTGDYYEGDPGFFGSLGRFAKGIMGAGIRSIPGVGAMVSGVGSIARAGSAMMRVRQATTQTRALPSMYETGYPGALSLPSEARMRFTRPPMPGGAPLMLPPAGGAVARAGPCVKMSPRGRRIRVNCRTGKAIRHMRVTNPKALRRAIRRANGFAKLARKVMHFTSARAPKGRAIFRKRRKR